MTRTIREREARALVIDRPGITAEQVAEALRINLAQATQALESLRHRAAVEKVGDGWRLPPAGVQAWRRDTHAYGDRS